MEEKALLQGKRHRNNQRKAEGEGGNGTAPQAVHAENGEGQNGRKGGGICSLR